MQVIAIEKVALDKLKALKVPGDRERIIQRHVRLVEVNTTAGSEVAVWLDEHMPELTSFEVFVGFYRNTPEGREIASGGKLSERMVFGKWAYLDDDDWNHLTVVTDFNVQGMLLNAIKGLAEKNHALKAIEGFYEKAVIVSSTQGRHPEFLCVCICLEISPTEKTGLDWFKLSAIEDKLCPMDRDLFIF